jgi:hypothetical protein
MGFISSSYRDSDDDGKAKVPRSPLETRVDTGVQRNQIHLKPDYDDDDDEEEEETTF